MHWSVGAEHPHRLVLNTAVNNNPRAKSSLRSEWRRDLGLKGPFVTSQGFIAGSAVHPEYPIVAVVGYDKILRLFNRISGKILWGQKLKATEVGAPQFIGDQLLIPTGDGLLTAYHIKEQEVLWRRQFSGLIRHPLLLVKS